MRVHLKRGLHSVGILGLRLPLVISDVVSPRVVLQTLKTIKMKICYSVFTLLTAILITVGCSKNNSSSNSTSSNPVIKYEIITSVPVTNTSALGAISLMYLNGTDQWESTGFSSGTSWTKEFNITTSSRPFTCQFNGRVSLVSPGSVTCNIYVNGEQKAHNENAATATGGMYYVAVSPFYIIQQ